LVLDCILLFKSYQISGLFRVAARGWISTYIIDTIKMQSRTKKYTALNKIDKFYDRLTTSAVVSMADSSVCNEDY